jgi:hypothetical protein
MVASNQYGPTITEHDPERPLIVHDTEHRTVRLEDHSNFYAWAHQQWPEPRWTVDLDPALPERARR